MTTIKTFHRNAMKIGHSYIEARSDDGVRLKMPYSSDHSSQRNHLRAAMALAREAGDPLNEARYIGVPVDGTDDAWFWIKANDAVSFGNE